MTLHQMSVTLDFAEMQGEQQAIEDKDAALALLYDILPVIKYENSRLKGKIHTKD